MFYGQSWREVPLNNGFTGKIPFFFLSHLTEDQMQKLITKLIFHQIPLLTGLWENIHLMANYVWGLGGPTRYGVADWQVWDTACVFRTLLALLAYLTACSHEEATWTHASTGAKALPAVSTNTVWDWSCVTLYPHTTSYFSWQHQHLSTSYGMLDGTLLLKWDSALCGVYDRGMRESLCRYVWRHVHLTPLRPYTALVAGASPPEGIFTLLPYFLCRVQ